MSLPLIKTPRNSLFPMLKQVIFSTTHTTKKQISLQRRTSRSLSIRINIEKADHRVFMDFLGYIQRFPNLKYTEDMESEDIEGLKAKLSKFKKMRSELEEFEEISELELVQLWNLCPVINTFIPRQV